MTETPNGLCTCRSDQRPGHQHSRDGRDPYCGVPAHRREARDNDFADAVKGLAAMISERDDQWCCDTCRRLAEES